MIKYSSTAAKIKLFTAKWEVKEKKHKIQSHWQIPVMSEISATRKKKYIFTVNFFNNAVTST
jgi:hypothetical protein